MVKCALLIGFNYEAIPRYTLNGCIADCALMYKTLRKRGYDSENITFITDASKEVIEKTFGKTKMQILTDYGKSKILKTISNRIYDPSITTLCVYYAGHGGQTPTVVEEDKKDELLLIPSVSFKICSFPYCSFYVDTIKDNELHLLIYKCIKSRAEPLRLFTIFDNCNSGSVLDLPFYSINSKTLSYESKYDKIHRTVDTSKLLHYCISSSSDHQDSYETQNNNSVNGIFTTIITKCFDSKSKPTVQNIFDCTKTLHEKPINKQNVVISSNKKFNLNTTISL